MALVQFQEAPSRGKKTYGNLPAGHPCPIAKGLGDAMREILDFCIFMSKTELWKLTARRDADFHRPVPNLFSISIILSVPVYNMNALKCTISKYVCNSSIWFLQYDIL